MSEFEFYLHCHHIERWQFAQTADINRITAIEFYAAGFPMLARAVGRSVWRDYVEWGGLGMSRDTLYWFARHLYDSDVADSLRTMESIAGYAANVCKRRNDFNRHYII